MHFNYEKERTGRQRLNLIDFLKRKIKIFEKNSFKLKDLNAKWRRPRIFTLLLQKRWYDGQYIVY